MTCSAETAAKLKSTLSQMSPLHGSAHNMSHDYCQETWVRSHGRGVFVPPCPFAYCFAGNLYSKVVWVTLARDQHLLLETSLMIDE